MSIYRFSDASKIKEVSFHFANDRPPVALLVANENASEGQLTVIRKALQSHGWQSVPVFADGKEALEVIGHKKAEQLTEFLKRHQFVDGAPQITGQEGDHPRRTVKEWVKHDSLRAAGALNLIGDVGLLGSGLKSGRSYETIAGGLYTAGGAILTRYGDIKTELQVREVLEDTAKFLKQQAGQLPEDCELSGILKHHREGKLNDIEDFLHRYPAQVTLGAYTLGAGSMLMSGIKSGKRRDVHYGTYSLAVKAASFAIPEKSEVDDKKKSQEKHGAVGKLIEWVREKPLRLFGYGSMVSEVLLGLSAYDEYKHDPKQRSYIFKGITTGTYLLSDLLMAVSNKNTANAEGKFDPDEQRRILALAADAIAHQPKELREPLTQKAARFLTANPEMKGTTEDIGGAIGEQVAHMESNPWTSRSRAIAEATTSPSRA